MLSGVTDLGFLLCGCAFLALAVVLRPGFVAKGTPRLRLRIAALATAAWTAIAWWIDQNVLDDIALSQLLPLAFVGIWLWQFETLARWQGLQGWISQGLRWSGVGSFALALAWVWTATGGASQGLESAGALSLLGLALCIFGLIAVEQTYRNADPAYEPALRWLGLGIGGLLMTELLVFAESFLLGEVSDLAWPLRGALFTLCALAIIRGARRVPDWSFGLSVSRQVVFYAGSLLLIGGYLVLLGLVSWLSLTYTGQWHPVARLGFVALAGVGLGAAFFSRGLLAKFKVYIATHLYPQRYDHRVEWQRLTRTLSSEDESTPVPSRAVQAMAQIVGSSWGALWRRDREGAQFVCAVQWPESRYQGGSTPSQEELPAYLQRTSWLVDLKELRSQPSLYGNLRAPEAIAACCPDGLLIPLLYIDQLYGWILLERPAHMALLDFEDRDLLKIAGRQLAAHLAQFDSDLRLTEAQQFETYNRMTAFVMHDLKNIAAQLGLISQNAERHGHNPEFVQDAFRTVSSSATRMTRLIAQLKQGQEAGPLLKTDLAHCAQRAAQQCEGRQPAIQLVIQDRAVVTADPDRLVSVIEHGLRNALDATPGHGRVELRVWRRGPCPLLTIHDTGSGMDDVFLKERLFRPFDSTKGERGMGIGAYQIREYLRSIGGDVEVESTVGQGTALRLVFPPMDETVVIAAESDKS